VDNVSTALIVVAIVASAEILGWAAQKIGQPKVLGELATGLVLGASVLGILDPNTAVISTLSEIGLLVLLFDIGLHTNIRALAQVGPASLTVGSVGVVIPLILGWGVAELLGLTSSQAIMCGAALTATSIGISARVLQDLGKIDSLEGRVVLGAAVLDDIAGLVILALTSAFAGGSAANNGGQGHSILGSVAILVAFATGMMLHHTRIRFRAQKVVGVLGFVVVPIFFAAVGAAVQVRSISGWQAIALLILLLVVGTLGKFIAGYAPRRFTGNKALVGLAMVPRGEVGLVFATTAHAAGIFDDTLFSVVTLVVMATTFLTPPVLSRIVKQTEA
jgi:Kef-type K+ transport system membrane component KefB